MKNTKKYLIGFIIAIISIIPISSVKALTIDNRNYDLPDLPNSYAETYPYTIAKDNNNEIYLIFFTDSRTINNLDNSTFTNYNSGGVTLGGGFITYSIYTYNKNVRYYKLENNEWVYINYGTYGVINYSFEDIGITQEEFRSNPTIVKPFLQDKILYTNVNYFVCDGKPTLSEDCTLFFSNEDLKPQEYISFEYELINNNYYIKFYTDNFNSNYKYYIKFDSQALWTDVTNTLSNGAFYYTLTKNSTLYMQVLNENGESIETKTMTFSDITYNEENYTPSVEIDVLYSTGINNLAKANVVFNIKNYSPIYYYKYSFNDIEDININTSDIVNNQYSFETYQNGIVYFYVYNQEGEVVYKTSKIIDSVLDNEIYYYYEFDMSKFYNESDNSINTLVFYYEEGETLINDKKVLPYINMYLLGEDNKLLPFYITYSTDVIDVNTFSKNVNFDKSINQYLPYEKLFESKISYHNKSYTAYAIAPIMDLTNNTFEDYDNYKLVIRTTKKMSNNYFSFIDGVMLPQPDINTDLENYNTSKSIFDMFLNPIKEKIPIFWQLPNIFNSLNFDKGDGTLPPVLVDFSFLGIDKQLNVIDFSYFVEYRPYLFGILKIILGFWTLRNVNKNLNL